MNSTRYQYDDLARPLKIKRWGVIDSDGETEKFGLLDDLTFEYDGARLSGYGQNPDTYDGEEFFQRVSMPMVTATRQYSKGRLTQERGIGDIFYAYNRRGQPKATVSVVAGFPYTETSLVKTHDCHGRLTAKTGSIKQGNNETVSFDRQYVEGFVFNNGGLERVDFTGGYFDAQGAPHYLLTDRLGSVVLVVSGDNVVEARYGYYPYGEMWRNASGQQRRLAAKERETLSVPGDYCFGPRTYRPGLTLWDTADRYNSQYPWLSPFTYCAANPIKFTDPTGNILFVKDGNKNYYWKNNGGAWGLYDGVGNRYNGNDDFIIELNRALHVLWDTESGKDLLTFLTNLETEIPIMNSYKGSFPSLLENEVQYVFWDYSGKEYSGLPGGGRVNPIASLGHELGHIYNNLNPNLQVKGVWMIINTEKGLVKIGNCEKVAIHIENKIRKNLGLPLRMYYTESPVHEAWEKVIKTNDGINYRSMYFDNDENYYNTGVPRCCCPYSY